MQKSDGMNYAPVSAGEPVRVCEPGAFPFAVAGLDHGHIYGMCNGLTEAGATLTRVHDPDPAKVAAFCERFPQARPAASLAEILADPSVQLVASASVPDRRAALGVQVLASGRHFFADKPAMTTAGQLTEVRQAVARSGRRFFVYFSERLHSEGAVFAGRLIAAGAIGRVLHATILAPHRLNAAARPDWFFDPARTGGILNDIGSHQFEQFLAYTGASSARVVCSRNANYACPDHPGFADFGDCLLEADNGATGYCRLDWFTPDGLRAWGDGRVFLVGTNGTLEIRKYLDLAGDAAGDHVLLVNADGEQRFDVHGQVGFPFFGELIRDCLDGTEQAMSQAHILEAMRLALEAEARAVRVAAPEIAQSMQNPML